MGRCARWVLGFGGAARVIAPARLAQEILEAIEEARERYIPRLAFPMLRMLPRATEHRQSQSVSSRAS